MTGGGEVVVDGLAEMRARRTGRVNAPIHPKKLVVAQPAPEPEPESDPEPTRVETIEVTEPEPPQENEVAEKPPAKKRADRPSRIAINRPQTVPPLRATQVLLDETADNFISQVVGMAIAAGVKDITLSGIIRYALHRLGSDMQPEEVINAMLETPAVLRHPGRRR